MIRKFSGCNLWTCGDLGHSNMGVPGCYKFLVPLTTNAFRSTHWVSLHKLWNFGSWSESMENLELKWRFICTHKPNSNVLTHGVFRLACLIGQYMWYIQQTHQGYKVKRGGGGGGGGGVGVGCVGVGGGGHLLKDDSSRNLYPWAVLRI